MIQRASMKALQQVIMEEFQSQRNAYTSQGYPPFPVKSWVVSETVYWLFWDNRRKDWTASEYPKHPNHLLLVSKL